LAKQLKYITIFVVLALLQLTKVGATEPFYNLDSLNFLLQKNLKPKDKVDVLIKIASVYHEEGNPAAQKYVLEAHELSKKLKYDNGLGQTFFIIAQSKEGKVSFDSLDFLYKESISAFSKAGLEEKEAYARNSLGIVYERVGRYKKALELYYSSLLIFRRLENKEGIANEINNIESFTIIHLNSLGFVVHSVNLTIISFISFETSGNYTDNDLHINKINFLVRLN
jgi:tetratricopeptide (TPR) repeat protein